MATPRPKLSWYWHRFRAMNPREVGLHVRKKLRQKADAKGLPDWSGFKLEQGMRSDFPVLPRPADLPPALRSALERDAREILAGRWKAFGHLDIQVENPPRWQKDHLVGKDLETEKSAFKVSYRQHPDGADIKLIWEPSRWNQLVRLAQAAWLLKNAAARETCLAWLEDWLAHNRPYFGLNWTSALETGMRLMQFVWIDSMLVAAGADAQRLSKLRRDVLLPHVWYTWRYRSFGSSANNHLIGELAGLALALARWPALEKISTPVAYLHSIWEREVLVQFAEDGGNKEEALGYHLFSWEFCWQSKAAFLGAGRSISPEVVERLEQAARFYAALKLDHWDFGDSDNAFVTPFFCDEGHAAEEWRNWFLQPESSPGISFWWGAGSFAKERSTPAAKAGAIRKGEAIRAGWRMFESSGYGLNESPDWTLRWDLSNLGFLATAAHGHLDALHVSIWRKGQPLVIDPGTGAYYADKPVRDHLASWDAHNGPSIKGSSFPERLGGFLWGKPHTRPSVNWAGPAPVATLQLPEGEVWRKLRPALGGGWQVEDGLAAANSAGASLEFQVRWQFPPGCEVTQVSERRWRVQSEAGLVLVEAGPAWKKVELFVPSPEQARLQGHRLEDLGQIPLSALCSPAFRRVGVSAFLRLTGGAGGSEGCWTRFGDVAGENAS